MSAAPIAMTASAAAPATPGAGGRPKLEHAFLALRDPPVDQGSMQPGPPSWLVNASLSGMAFEYVPMPEALESDSVRTAVRVLPAAASADDTGVLKVITFCMELPGAPPITICFR